MDFKKSLKDVLVLVIICAVFATVLAAVNSVTAPIIADRLAGAANEAYNAVMPGAAGFEDVDLSTYSLPATVKEAKRETSGKGFAIKLETKGYATGMVLIVGISTDGVVTGSTCIASNETWGLENSLGEKVVGKDISTIVDVEAGATSLTVNGYRAAVKDAINAATILGGGSVDIRTEEEILNDNLLAALPTGEGKFVKMLMVEAVEGVNAIYSAGEAGYVCIIGEGEEAVFVGVGADGVAVGESESNAIAEAAIAIVAATEYTDVNLADYEGISAKITSIQKTATGNYVIKLKADGYGINGDHYIASGKHIEMVVCISKDGKILDAQTLSHEETDSFGGIQLKDGALNSKFIGKNETEASAVDVKNGSTITSEGYKKAILNAFAAYTILEGGTN